MCTDSEISSSLFVVGPKLPTHKLLNYLAKGYLTCVMVKIDDVTQI